MRNVMPGKEVPELIVNTVNGMKWDLRDQKPERFTLLVFYRGLHCPKCKEYLEHLNSRINKFRAKGINVMCVSGDKRYIAEKTVTDWEVDRLTIGYGLPEETARKWDLYISEGIKEEEPNIFFEPGTFLINPDNTLYAASVQSMPFGRPEIDNLLKSLDSVPKNGLPSGKL